MRIVFRSITTISVFLLLAPSSAIRLAQDHPLQNHSSQNRQAQNRAGQTRPNIVMILADDLGYGDLACYGGGKILTPNIDQMAREGIRFTDFHSASAVSSPSRAGILTGRYPARFGVTRAFRDAKEDFLKVDIVTLPKLLRQAGYATAHVGRWHLGGLRKSDISDHASNAPGPIEHGFDQYLSMNEETDPRARLIRGRSLYRQGAQFLFRNDKPAPPS